MTRSLLRVLASPIVQALGVLLGFAGAVSVAITAYVVGQLPGVSREWWFTVPASWLEPANQRPISLIFYLSLGTVALGWVLIGIGVRAGRWRIRQLWMVGGSWALPWLVAPVALSTDVYTYLGQGLVVGTGLDPYTHGPAVAGLPALIAQRMAGIWLNQPSPYGPGFMGIDGLIAPLARDHLILAVVVMRVITLAGLVLAAVCLPRVARKAGGDPVVATWLGVTSPLALGAIVLSGHNDALMVGFVMAALAMATMRYKYAALGSIALATLAAMIKLPSGVAIVVLALGWALQTDQLRERLKRIGAAAGVALGVTVIVSLITTLGVRWINPVAIMSPKLAAPTFTPVNAVANDFCDILFDSFGVYVDRSVMLHVIQVSALCLGGLLGIAVLIGLRKIGTVRAVAILLSGVLLASPVLWPWYFVWPIMLLGTFTRGWLRVPLIVLAAGALFLTSADGSPHYFQRVAVFVVAVLVIATAVGTAIWVGRTLAAKQTEPARANAAHA